MFEQLKALTAANNRLNGQHQRLRELQEMVQQVIGGSFQITANFTDHDFCLPGLVGVMREDIAGCLAQEIDALRVAIGTTLLEIRKISHDTYGEVMSQCTGLLPEKGTTPICGDSSGAESASDTTNEKNSTPEVSTSTVDFTAIAENPYQTF